MGDLATRDAREFEAAERSEILKEMKEILTSFQSLADSQLTIHRVSYKQGVVLRHLKLRSSCTVTELATAAGVDMGWMTRMLERLEAKGLLERRRSSTDKRVVYVSLLEPGETVAAIADEVLVSVAENHLKGFVLEERAQFSDFLARMRVNGRTLGDG